MNKENDEATYMEGVATGNENTIIDTDEVTVIDVEEGTVAEESIVPEIDSGATYSAGIQNGINTPSPATQKKDSAKKTLKQKIADFLTTATRKFRSSYAKRSVITNIVLSLYLLLALLLFALLMLVAVISMGNNKFEYFAFFILIASSGTPLFLIHVYQFVVMNRKEYVKKSFASLFLAMIPWVFWYVVLDSDASFAFIVLAAAFVTVVISAVVYMSLRFKKYGASAWTLLDVPRTREKETINPQNLFYTFGVIGVLISISYILGFISSLYAKATEKYRPAEKAEIGDYYYNDGTVSSELLTDKTCIGIVFSLETTENEKKVGYSNGHIVDLEDKEKVLWNYSGRDVDEYPNYTWENRHEALKDREGLAYMQEYNIFADNNSGSMNYGAHASDWYLPTAGDWKDILENIGGVEVNSMLQFDATVANEGLSKLNLNPKRWYWTATEQDEDHAWSIRIANGEFGSRTPKDNPAYVRYVAAF